MALVAPACRLGARSGEADVSEPKVAVHLPLPEMLETLLIARADQASGISVETDVLALQALVLVKASRLARKKVEQALATMPITIGFAPAEPVLTDAELAEIRARHAAATSVLSALGATGAQRVEATGDLIGRGPPHHRRVAWRSRLGLPPARIRDGSPLG